MWKVVGPTVFYSIGTGIKIGIYFYRLDQEERVTSLSFVPNCYKLVSPIIAASSINFPPC